MTKKTQNNVSFNETTHVQNEEKNVSLVNYFKNLYSKEDWQALLITKYFTNFEISVDKFTELSYKLDNGELTDIDYLDLLNTEIYDEKEFFNLLDDIKRLNELS